MTMLQTYIFPTSQFSIFLIRRRNWVGSDGIWTRLGELGFSPMEVAAAYACTFLSTALNAGLIWIAAAGAEKVGTTMKLHQVSLDR